MTHFGKHSLPAGRKKRGKHRLCTLAGVGGWRGVLAVFAKAERKGVRVTSRRMKRRRRDRPPQPQAMSAAICICGQPKMPSPPHTPDPPPMDTCAEETLPSLDHRAGCKAQRSGFKFLLKPLGMLLNLSEPQKWARVTDVSWGCS